MRADGGAVCRITKLENLEKKLAVTAATKAATQDRAQFHMDWSWRVSGEVAHWGHRHTRKLDYHAMYTVAHDGESWKIADVEILDLQRVDK